MINRFHYERYNLTKDVQKLSNRELEYLKASVYIAEKKKSLREAKEKYDISVPGLHYWIRKHLKDLSYELYNKVDKQLEKNKKNASYKGGKMRWQ